MVKFVIEYSKSGRAGCKFSKCKKNIDKDTVRVGKISSSPFSEGADMTQWLHVECFFEQLRGGRAVKPEALDELEGYSTLKKPDQKKIDKWFAEISKDGKFR
jgi:hypothetical protein